MINKVFIWNFKAALKTDCTDDSRWVLLLLRAGV